MFPADRQLSHLHTLELNFMRDRQGDYIAIEISAVARCCPNLRFLAVPGGRYSAAQLAPLTGLQHLTTLFLSKGAGSGHGAMGAICQLTQLRQLGFVPFSIADDGELLLLLTPLRQLEALACFTNSCIERGSRHGFSCQVCACVLQSSGSA
jgi:hypothetical protein